MQNVFVYFHINSFTEEVFYVGIGVKFRPYRRSGRSTLWSRTVKKYGYKVKIVHTLDSWDEAKRKEIEYIKFFGRIDKQTGILVNHTDGGDGTLGGIFNVGRKASEETKRKQSEKLKGRPIHLNTINARKLVSLKGTKRKTPVSDETKARISQSKKGTVISDAQRKKVSEKLKNRYFSPEHRAKISDGVKRFRSKL